MCFPDASPHTNIRAQVGRSPQARARDNLASCFWGPDNSLAVSEGLLLGRQPCAPVPGSWSSRGWTPGTAHVRQCLRPLQLPGYRDFSVPLLLILARFFSSPLLSADNHLSLRGALAQTKKGKLYIPKTKVHSGSEKQTQRTKVQV